MKAGQIEVTFSEREYEFFEQYSKENRVHINDVVRMNLEQWLRKWDLSDIRVYLRKGPVIVRGRMTTSGIQLTRADTARRFHIETSVNT